MLVVRVLGTVRAERDGRAVEFSSRSQRLLLAVLAAARGPVPRSRLVDALWPEEPPASATATLMAYVSRLRAALGADAVASGADSYRLTAERIDATDFEAALHAGDPSVARLEQALALWDGEAFGDVAEHPFLLSEAARLSDLRMTARLRLASAYLSEGDTARPTSMLEAVVAEDPLREDAWVLLVEALLRAGRTAEAALAANRARRRLAALGLEPGPALADAQARALQTRIGPADPGAPAISPVRYARSGEAHLGFQLVGQGSVDLILSSYNSVSIDAFWDCPPLRRFVLRLAAGSRVVLYDTRGIGLSDPIDVARPPSLGEQSDDLAAVLAAVGSTRSVVVGVGDGGPTVLTYAHRRPPGLVGLVLVNTFARLVAAPDYPDGIPAEVFESALANSVDPESKRGAADVLRNHAPSVAADADFCAWWDRAGRRGASPATAAALWRVRYGADVRALVPGIETPALIAHRQRSRIVGFAHGVYLAEHLPAGRLVALSGRDQTPFTEGADELTDRILAFAAEVSCS